MGWGDFSLEGLLGDFSLEGLLPPFDGLPPDALASLGGLGLSPAAWVVLLVTLSLAAPEVGC